MALQINKTRIIFSIDTKYSDALDRDRIHITPSRPGTNDDIDGAPRLSQNDVVLTL